MNATFEKPSINMAPALFSALIVAIAACAHAAPEPNTLTLAEKTAGWQRLFDGSSLNGWQLRVR